MITYNIKPRFPRNHSYLNNRIYLETQVKPRNIQYIKKTIKSLIIRHTKRRSVL